MEMEPVSCGSIAFLVFTFQKTSEIVASSTDASSNLWGSFSGLCYLSLTTKHTVFLPQFSTQMNSRPTHTPGYSHVYYYHFSSAFQICSWNVDQDMLSVCDNAKAKPYLILAKSNMVKQRVYLVFVKLLVLRTLKGRKKKTV